MSGDLAPIVGGPVASIEPLRWGFGGVAELVTLADGRRVVVKRFRGSDAAQEVRRAVEAAPRLADAGIPTPRVVAADPAGDPPWVVFRPVDGRPGVDWLDTPARARVLATTMGRLAVDLRRVTVTDPGGPWSDPARLAQGARGWLDRLGGGLGPAVVAAVADAVAVLPAAYAERPPAFAHGDFVPVNVLLGQDGRLAALLDLGESRIAHPWLDVAWWGWVVRTFHPEAWVASWPAMLEAAGIPGDKAAARTLHRLQVVRCLEWAAARGDPTGPRLLAETTAWHTAG